MFFCLLLCLLFCGSLLQRARLLTCCIGMTERPSCFVVLSWFNKAITIIIIIIIIGLLRLTVVMLCCSFMAFPRRGGSRNAGRGFAHVTSEAPTVIATNAYASGSWIVGRTCYKHVLSTAG